MIKYQTIKQLSIRGYMTNHQFWEQFKAYYGKSFKYSQEIDPFWDATLHKWSRALKEQFINDLQNGSSPFVKQCPTAGQIAKHYFEQQSLKKQIDQPQINLKAYEKEYASLLSELARNFNVDTWNQLRELRTFLNSKH